MGDEGEGALDGPAEEDGQHLGDGRRTTDQGVVDAMHGADLARDGAARVHQLRPHRLDVPIGQPHARDRDLDDPRVVLAPGGLRVEDDDVRGLGSAALSEGVEPVRALHVRVGHELGHRGVHVRRGRAGGRGRPGGGGARHQAARLRIAPTLRTSVLAARIPWALIW